MTLKTKISKIILLLVCCLLLIASCNKPKYQIYGKDPFPQINLPVFSDAFQIYHVINRPVGAKSVQYKIKIRWPAKQLIDFYNSEFYKMGLSKYSKDNYGGGEWGHFIDGTQKGNPEINQYLETWVDKNHSIRILLSLRYNRTKNGPWPKEVSVACQVTKFYDFTKLNEFFERLRRSGKDQQFNTLIARYSKSNH